MAQTILLVEDSDEDYVAFCRAFKQAGQEENNIKIVRCAKGDEALDYLGRRERSTKPLLILLDLNLPGMNGHTVLARIKGDEQLRAIPVIILTTSSNPRDVLECYTRGASSYITKGTDYEGFKHSVRLLCEYWLTVNTSPNLGEAQL